MAPPLRATQTTLSQNRALVFKARQLSIKQPGNLVLSHRKAYKVAVKFKSCALLCAKESVVLFVLGDPRGQEAQVRLF